MKTRPRLLRLINLRSQWLFTGIGSFFTELELWWKLLFTLFLFFNEHKFRGKTARILRLFFNEHELYAKTARYTSHNKNASCEITIF